MLEGLRVTLLAIGKARRGPEQQLFEHYAKRLSFRLTVRELEESKSGSGLQRREREADLLLGAVPKGARILALDETGRALGSMAFAQLLGRWRDDAVQDIAVIIGGADGLSPRVREAADRVLAFGPATWPHLLVRTLLAEQLYRAQTILQGHPYHRA